MTARVGKSSASERQKRIEDEPTKSVVQVGGAAALSLASNAAIASSKVAALPGGVSGRSGRGGFALTQAAASRAKASIARLMRKSPLPDQVVAGEDVDARSGDRQRCAKGVCVSRGCGGLPN
jgi:hypothetical protein